MVWSDLAGRVPTNRLSSIREQTAESAQIYALLASAAGLKGTLAVRNAVTWSTISTLPDDEVLDVWGPPGNTPARAGF